MRVLQRHLISATVLYICLWNINVCAALDVTCFTNAGAVLSTPSSASWQTDRSVFNEKINTQPAAVAYAYDEEQVKGIVQCAQASGLEAVPRSGGHGYEGYAVESGKVVVDVTNITFFEVAPDNQTATFGSGLRLGQLFLHMYLEAQSLFPAGLCPWVGTAGHILGGGTGLNSRRYGLACDQVLEVKMLDARGELIVANASQNQDLLWASCGGGGGNLGIVTSFKVKLTPLSQVPVVTTIQLSWPGFDQAVDIFDLVQRWAPNADPRMGMQVFLGSGSISLNGQWLGSKEEAQAQIDASGLLSIPNPWLNKLEEQSWINATLFWAAGTQGIPTNSIYDLNMSAGVPPGDHSSFQASSSYNQQPMSREGIQAMVNAVQQYPNNAFVEHKMLLGAVSNVTLTETAFYYRNSLYETQWYFHWDVTEGDLQSNANQWLSATMATMKPYVGQGAYINYPDPLLAQTSSWPQDYYGGNLQRYIDVKTKYDPTNYFSNPLTVKPSQGALGSPGLTPATAPVEPLTGGNIGSSPPSRGLPVLPVLAPATAPAAFASPRAPSGLPGGSSDAAVTVSG